MWKQQSRSELDEIVIFETIRKNLATPDLPATEFDNVVNITDILRAISLIFRKEDMVNGLMPTLKGKALNLCVNLCMGSQPTVQELFEPKYGVLE